jgi:hypothetical protein
MLSKTPTFKLRHDAYGTKTRFAHLPVQSKLHVARGQKASFSEWLVRPAGGQHTQHQCSYRSSSSSACQTQVPAAWTRVSVGRGLKCSDSARNHDSTKLLENVAIQIK